MNCSLVLLFNELNHSMVSYEFFNCLRFNKVLIFLLMLSRNILLTFPILGLHGLISLHLISSGNLSLWSFIVIYASFLGVISTLSSIFNSFMIWLFFFCFFYFQYLVQQFCMYLLHCLLIVFGTFFYPLHIYCWFCLLLQIGLVNY